MDANNQLDPASIKGILLSRPKTAWQYDQMWKQLQTVFKKVAFKRIRTQAAWDSFFKTLTKKELSLFRFPHVINDPNLWLIGPITQDEQVQKVINDYAITLSPEEKEKATLHADTSRDHHSGHGGEGHADVDVEKASPDPVIKKVTQEQLTPKTTMTTPPKVTLTPEQWYKHLSPNTPSAPQVPASPHPLIQEKPDHELIRQAEKEIMRRANTDPDVIQFFRGPNRNNATMFKQVKQEAYQTHARDVWDTFIKEEPELAKQFSSYAPIAAAIKRKEQPPAQPNSPRIHSPLTNQPHVPTPSVKENQTLQNVPLVRPTSFTSQYTPDSPPPRPPVYSRQPETPEQDAQEPPSHTPSRRQRRGVPAFKNPFGIGGGARTALARVAFLNPYVLGGLIAIAVIFILFFVITGDDGTIEPPKVTKTTVNTEIPNPPDTTICQSNPQACEQLTPELGVVNAPQAIAYTGGPAVLQAADTNLTDLFDGTVGGLAEFIKRLRESKITYDINVSYSGQADDIIVTDPIPDNAYFLNATGICHVKRKDTGNIKNKVYEVWWSMKENTGADLNKISSCNGVVTSTPTPSPSTPTSPPTSGSKVNYNRYTQSPYFLPAASGGSEGDFDQNTVSALNTLGSLVAKHQSYLISKTGGAEYVDPFLSVIWTGAIEGIGGNQYFYNCLDSIFDPNQGCPAGGFTSGGWQVGYGIQVSQATPHLAEDFDEAYGAGSSESVQKTQQVGQTVITASGGKISNPATFPAKSVQTLAQEALSGSLASRQAIAVLLMDKELGAIALAREVASDIKARNNWRATMEGWGSYYVTNMQRFANRASVLATLYSGQGGTSGSSGGSTFSPMTFKISILPEAGDELFTSSRTKVEVIGGRSPTSTSSAETGSSSGSGQAISLENVEKRLLPTPDASQCQNTQTQTCGRDSNSRVRVNKIVMHVTMGTLTAESTYQYFASGSDGRGVGSHFTIGNDGKIIQMVELFADGTEYAQTVGGYQNHISIEMGSARTYNTKAEMPAVQYTAAISLVKALMQKYNIPIGSIEWTTSNQCYGNGQDFTIDDTVKGIFGHYQLNPCSRTDPGSGWMRDFRNDLK